MELLTRNLRDELILTTTCEWIKADPETASDFARYAKQAREQQYHSSGAWRGTKDGYIKYRMPQNLLDCIRLVFHTYGIDEVFGMDDKDMKLLCREFPDLFGFGSNMDK